MAEINDTNLLSTFFQPVYDELNNLRIQVESDQTEFNRMNMIIGNVQSQNDLLTAQVNSITELNNQIDNFQNEIAEKDEQIINLQSQVISLQSQLSDLQNPQN